MLQRRTVLLWGAIALLAATALGQVIWEFNFDTITPGTIPSGWGQNKVDPNVSGNVRWQVVRSSQLWGEPSTLLNFPSSPNALYFGIVDEATGTGSYRDGNNSVGYILETSWIPMPSPRPNHIRVSFYHLREVEYYGTGDKEYDITEVLYRWGSSASTLKKWSSKDPSGKTWTKFESDAIAVPSSGSLALQFKFDSVDGNFNGYFGWLIDNIVVEVYPLTIKTVGLPEGTVDSQYSAKLDAVGGVGNYTWSVASGYNLPPRLVLDPNGQIRGTPEVPGDYYVVFEVKDQSGKTSQKGLRIKIHPADQTGYTIFSEQDFASGWQRNPDRETNLWRIVSICSDQGAYFGKEKENASYPSNYDIGQRAYGYLVSPAIDVSQYQGLNIELRFDYSLEVEHYVAAHVDKTFVEVQFDEKPWALVWYRDSTQTSSWDCQSPSSAVITKYFDSPDDIVVPQDARWMRIRFGFDTVDRYDNDHEGWFIRNLKVKAVQPTLQIVTRELPPVYIGVPYYAKLEARGGKPPYIWTVSGRLPDGLRLDRTTGEISGTVTDPDLARRDPYKFTFKVTDGHGTNVEKELDLLVSAEVVALFADSFDNGFDKWLAEDRGLWRFTNVVKGVPLAGHGFVAYYGQNETTNPNYNTGSRTLGYLTSVPFDIPSGTNAFKLVFDYWREVEYYAPGGYDKTYVEVRFLTGTDWTQWYRIWYKDSAHASEKTWTTESIGAYAIPSGATKMQIRFVFDSVDRFYNNYVGWLIDNVKVEMASSGSPLPTTSLEPMTKPRGDFAVFNIPNPVRDVHTTTFVVRGVEADLIRVEVYDLTGRLVYAGEAPGNELVWHTQDLLGRYLANGVYLYKVLVKVGDTWIVSDVQKIVILR